MAKWPAQVQLVVPCSDGHLVPARRHCQFARDQEPEGLAVYRRQTHARGPSECIFRYKPSSQIAVLTSSIVGLVSGNRPERARPLSFKASSIFEWGPGSLDEPVRGKLLICVENQQFATHRLAEREDSNPRYR